MTAAAIMGWALVALGIFGLGYALVLLWAVASNRRFDRLLRAERAAAEAQAQRAALEQALLHTTPAEWVAEAERRVEVEMGAPRPGGLDRYEIRSWDGRVLRAIDDQEDE